METKLAQIGMTKDVTGATTSPIYTASAYKHEKLGMSTGFDYTRTKNPTRSHFEEAFADLEQGSHAFATSSGMAAIQLVCNLFKPGDEVLVSFDLYGGTFRIFEFYEEQYGIKFIYVDFDEIEEVKKHIHSATKAFFIEPITNPSMIEVALAPIYRLAKEHDIMTIIDNTFLTPFYYKPLVEGADIVLHSATKYIGGHNDVLAGVVTVQDEALGNTLSMHHNMIGATLSPFDGYLLLRGLKTLHLRMERSTENAQALSEYFSDHAAIDEVLYSGRTGMMSLRLGEEYDVGAFLENIKVCTFAESLGGTETFITFPFTQTHADMPDEERIKRGIDEQLIRLSVGVENIDDIREDLIQALAKAKKGA
ncbi:PLP-dependent transferase [Salinicoccus hispanicus]|uniref:homocysteine desulfhydrase n=1 Tax=Salinicoccus hispanicus TaxID=157225 RepID=A0A6N8U3Q8_9STAP|nr:PLP-dependent transferase [Salinicoccus hispanicus]MXQ51706.1 aminotransferase class I/II-fold pyridoxal phosphate-dependent enzyme [Salinicoccus hispanicus]